MAKKKYNPYDDVLGVVQNKGNYNTAKATGGDYNGYQQAAVKYYDNLYNNGYGDVAEELSKVDYTDALGVLGRYKPTSSAADELYWDVNENSALYMPSSTSSKSGYERDLEYTREQEERRAAERERSQARIDRADRILDDIMSRSDSSLGGGNGYYSDYVTSYLDAAQNPQTSDTVQALLDSYQAGKDTVAGLVQGHYATGKDQLDRINNFDVTSQPYYDTIMQDYKLRGYNSGQDVLAGGASGNAGNIDSYAAANANRQQLAFTNAGMQAALDTAAQNQNAWQTLYETMSGDISNAGNRNLAELGYIGDMYTTDSAERQAGLNAATALEQQEMQNRINRYLADIGAAESMYQTGVGADTDRYLADIGLDSAKYTADANVRAQQIASDASRYGYDADIIAQQIAADAAKYGYDADVLAQRIAADAQKYGYDADVTAQQIASDASKYGAYQDYLAALAGYGSSEKIAAAELASQEKQTQMNNTANRALQYWQGQYDKDAAERASGGRVPGTQLRTSDVMSILNSAADIYNNEIKSAAENDVYVSPSRYDEIVSGMMDAVGGSRGSSNAGNANQSLTIETPNDSQLGEYVATAGEEIIAGRKTRDVEVDWLRRKFPTYNPARLEDMLDAYISSNK